MTAAMPFVRLGGDDDPPMLKLVFIAFGLALSLFIPAGIEAVWHAGRAVWKFFAAGIARRRRESPSHRRTDGDSSVRTASRPSCRGETDVRRCEWPFCRYALRDYHGLPFQEKLRLGLAHPVPDNRMLAIGLLGDSGDSSALAAFRELLRTERDPRVVVEIALAAAAIGGEDAKAILVGLKSHDSAMVREVAGELWEGMLDEGFIQ